MIATDKWAHMGITCSIALLIFVLTEWAIGAWAVIPSILIGALAGFGKEVLDIKRDGLDFEDINVGDLLADAVGLVIAVAAELINVFN